LPSTAERHDLNGDLRQRGDLDEPVQLRAHHRAPVTEDRPAGFGV
jgi:hypothetical protein